MENKKMKINLFISNLCLCFLLLLWSARGNLINSLSDSNGDSIVSDEGRNQPLYNNNGAFAIKNGKLMVLASSGTDLWSTELQFPSDNMTMELMASGNLVIKQSGVKGIIMWQSFHNPTDTFLPGINMADDWKLTSWKASDDPSSGISRFSKIQETLSTISVASLKANNYTVNFQSQELDYNYTRVVMNSTGRIQYHARNRGNGKWNVIWSEPKNICGAVSTCGTFASCRSDTEHTCRCLLGFEPKLKEEWDSGDFSNGCQRKSEICIKEEVEARDFLTINMKVRKTFNIVKINGAEECQIKCLESCIFLSDNEEPLEFSNLIFPVWMFPSEFTQLDFCKTCGSNIVPYPLSLSTESDCGNPLYRNFSCNFSTGQIIFQTADVYYNVTNINPQLKTFTIATNGSICRGNDTNAIQKLLKLEHSSTFKVSSNCNSEFNEIDIQWEKPFEPICSSLRDCTNWPNSHYATHQQMEQRDVCVILLLNELVPAAKFFQVKIETCLSENIESLFITN
ncbi:unnamed protein product [Citrullus colocynthis]|uniref:Bulb-type lectin domain-containing protein n=1 Tax=Citrullus colocynthis TaxID=252529 RepID=A0ABP0Y906_9ROSI